MGHHANKHLGALVHDNGVDFCVWAPFAQEVSLALSHEFSWDLYPMASDGSGYWSIASAPAAIGQSYKYRITAQDGTILEKNDPYAKQLTDSDLGASVIVDPSYDWGSEEKFSAAPHDKAIIYEMHVGTFNRPDASTPGTFYTAIEKLDYLSNLGVTYIELMPVTSMATSNGWGYAPNYIFSVENAYGGRRGLLDFVKACHAKGLGVILDVVYNHFFPETDLWQYDGWSEHNRGGIYFYNDERGDTPWGGRPDFGRPEVRQFILDNITLWLAEYKIDGLRLDSTIYLRNTEGNNDDHTHDIPEAWTLLGEITELARKINPNALLIAEDSSTNSHIVEPVTSGGAGFTAQWEVGFPSTLRDALGVTESAQGRLEGIQYEICHTFTGRSTDRVIYSDSHDTAANGSARLNELTASQNAFSSLGRKAELLANAVVLTSPGMPMLLQGSEFSQRGSFTDWQMLNWDYTGKFAGIVLAHQHLIRLRVNAYGNTAGLLAPNVEIFHSNPTNAVLGYRRWSVGGVNDEVLIIANFSDDHFETYTLKLPTSGTWSVRFNSSWKGYSPEFGESSLPSLLTANKHGEITIPLASYQFLLLGKHSED